MKIHFMTPCYGGQITEVCFSSYLQWTILALQNNLDFQIDTLSNESNVNRARNSCAAKFLAGDATHLMFVDADIQFRAEDIVKLVAHDRDIVGGIYPQKTLHLDVVGVRLHKKQTDNLPLKWNSLWYDMAFVYTSLLRFVRR